VREQLVAWAGDCIVRGVVELDDGRLSDQVNELDTVTFHDAVLHALDDGHEVTVGELEVDRGELHVIEVDGRRGDPTRRLRTVVERVVVEVGPFRVTGNFHRPPNTAPMAALSRRSRFVPMTDAVLELRDREAIPLPRAVVLLNKERIAKWDHVAEVPGSRPPRSSAAVAQEATRPH
jgi:hypothetical protein